LLFFFFSEVASAPELTITPAAGSSADTFTGNFTLVMADADVVGTNETVGQTRHWLVNGVTLKSVLAHRLDDSHAPSTPAARHND
jgi:hypothetical protein